MTGLDSSTKQNPQPRRPKISICIPTRNCAHFLIPAVESALRQTASDFEVLIVDNCSTDDTESVVHRLRERDSRIRYFRNAQDLGLVGNFNACLSYARGEYIKYLCADDLLLSDCVERMANCLDSHPSVTLVTAGRLIVDAAGRALSAKHYPGAARIVPGQEAIQRCLLDRHYIGEPTAVMFRKSAVRRGFNACYPQAVDIDMWFRLLEQGELETITEPLCMIRQHSGQSTRANIESGALIEDNVRLLEEYGSKAYINPTRFERMRHKIRIAWRIWISRKSLSRRRRDEIVEKYSHRVIYFLLMPPVSALIVAAGRIKRYTARTSANRAN
jgi:glycosyltransferase involved in cell wall biosynthesis